MYMVHIMTLQHLSFCNSNSASPDCATVYVFAQQMWIINTVYIELSFKGIESIAS